MKFLTSFFIFQLFILSFPKKLSPYECGKRLYLEKDGCKGEKDSCRELCMSNDE